MALSWTRGFRGVRRITQECGHDVLERNVLVGYHCCRCGRTCCTNFSNLWSPSGDLYALDVEKEADRVLQLRPVAESDEGANCRASGTLQPVVGCAGCCYQHSRRGYVMCSADHSEAPMRQTLDGELDGAGRRPVRQPLSSPLLLSKSCLLLLPNRKGRDTGSELARARRMAIVPERRGVELTQLLRSTWCRSSLFEAVTMKTMVSSDSCGGRRTLAALADQCASVECLSLTRFDPALGYRASRSLV